MTATVYTLKNIINGIQDKVMAITGVKLAPDYAPEQVAIFPAVITYPQSGYADIGEYGIAATFHNVVCEVHYTRSDLPTDIETVLPYLDKVITALTDDPGFSAICESGDRITYTFGVMQYAEVPTIGFRLTLHNIKQFPYGKQ